MSAVAHRYPGKQEPYLWSFTCGYALGWFAGWFGWNRHKSIRGQAAMLVCAITIVLAAARLLPDLQDHLVLAACYGAALAWVTGWCKNARRLSL